MTKTSNRNASRHRVAKPIGDKRNESVNLAVLRRLMVPQQKYRYTSPALDVKDFANTSGWLEHNILIKGNAAAPHGFGQYSGEFFLDADTSNLSIDFLNGRGEIVQAIELGAQISGPIAFQWDAINRDGRPLTAWCAAHSGEWRRNFLTVDLDDR